MLPSSRAPEATAFSRVGIGTAPSAASRPKVPAPRERPANLKILNPQEPERNERYEEPGRQDAARVAQDAVSEAARRAGRGAPELLARPLQGGGGRDREASRRPGLPRSPSGGEARRERGTRPEGGRARGGAGRGCAGP